MGRGILVPKKGEGTADFIGRETMGKMKVQKGKYGKNPFLIFRLEGKTNPRKLDLISKPPKANDSSAGAPFTESFSLGLAEMGHAFDVVFRHVVAAGYSEHPTKINDQRRHPCGRASWEKFCTNAEKTLNTRFAREKYASL